MPIPLQTMFYGREFRLSHKPLRHLAILLIAVELPELATSSLEAQKLWRSSSRSIRHFLQSFWNKSFKTFEPVRNSTPTVSV
jgi:hypothetical protein